MDLVANWERVQSIFDAAIRSSRHCAIASIDAAGHPHITPIGFIFLRDDYTAYYFEEYTANLAKNLEHNRHVCLSLVNSDTRFWGAFLLSGRFRSPPGVRLMGMAGERRPATAEEKASLRARIGLYRYLKGSRLIWSRLDHVRDIKIERFEPVVYPNVTDGLWAP